MGYEVCRHGSLRRSCETCDLEAEVERLRDGITTMVDAWWRETEPLWNVAYMLANLRDNREAPNLHSPSSEDPPRPVG